MVVATSLCRTSTCFRFAFAIASAASCAVTESSSDFTFACEARKRGVGMVAVLRRFHAALEQFLHAVVIGLVAPQIRASPDPAARRVDVSMASACFNDAPVLSSVMEYYGSPRYLRLQARHVGLRGRQARLKLLRIQLRKQIAFFHHRSFVHRQIHDASYDLRAYDYFVPVHRPRKRNLRPVRRVMKM